MAIRIPIIADVVAAIRDAMKLGESFDDVADALQDVDRKSDGAGSGVDDVTDRTRDASRGADDMEDSFRDAFESVRKQAAAAGDGVGTSMRHGTDEAGEGVQEFGREADSTAKETAASFDGSAESIVGSFQEIAANAFAGFGPAGAVAGLAAAAGIGIVTSKMEEAKEQAQETAQQVAEIAGELIDLGSSKLGTEQVEQALNDLATTAEDGKIPLDELRKTADAAGIAYGDYAQGVAGDSAALQRSYDEVQGALDDYQAGLDAVDKQYGHSSTQSLDYRKSVEDQVQALYAAEGALLKQDATLDRASTTAKNYADATDGLTEAAKREADAHDAAAKKLEEATALQDAYAASLVAAADPVGVYEGLLADKEAAERATAEATAAATKSSKDSWEDYATDVTVTTDDLIAEWNRQAAENEAFAANLAVIGAAGGQALADELKAKGPEVAAATAAAIAGADPAQQQAAIDAHAKATGTAMSTAIGTGITTGAGSVQSAVDGVAAGIKSPSVKVNLTPDTADIDRELAKTRFVNVQIPHRAGSAVAI